MTIPSHEDFRADPESFQAKDLKNYIEKAVKRLLGFENDGDFLRFLLEQNESSSSSSPNLNFSTEEEKEAVYRAVANRLYYSYYQFFLWYFWKSETLASPQIGYNETLGIHVLSPRGGTSHHNLTQTVVQKVPSLLASSDLNVTERELEESTRYLQNFRKHADYHLEIEFRDDHFVNLLQYYRNLRRIMEALSA